LSTLPTTSAQNTTSAIPRQTSPAVTRLCHGEAEALICRFL
jgi:hypothetical protein